MPTAVPIPAWPIGALPLAHRRFTALRVLVLVLVRVLVLVLSFG